jgi:outer membrane protein assembly factor BamA
MRGVMRNRVVGDGFILGNAELRWKMFRTVIAKQNFYLGLNAFADAGMVVQQIKYDKSLIPNDGSERHFNANYINHDGLHPSAGLGLRAVLNENFILAIDYGLPFNEQDGQKGGLYISIGNLF